MGEHKHVLMFSGGLDSYLAYLALKDNGIEPTLVYAGLGHRYERDEFWAALALANFHGEELIHTKALQLGGWEEDNAYIPMRNGFLGMAGALYGDRIWMAIMDGEQTYDDCKKGTFTALSLAISALSGKPVIVDSPFWDKTKAEVIASLNPHHYKLLLRTTSCHRAERVPGSQCGRCNACFRRWVAFAVNGIEDKFLSNPWEGSTADNYLWKVRQGDSYGGKRDEEIRQAFREVGRL
jgi:7-cyano-7-deazaguanine synthase in queuosine biosynthesis